MPKVKITKKAMFKAIRNFCIECNGGQLKGVSDCVSPKCVLYPFRMGCYLPEIPPYNGGKKVKTGVENEKLDI
jgi:hypothetical protein